MAGAQFKMFVSEEEIKENRKSRQEEWEKVRKPDDPEEAPEEVVDNRSLFYRLEEQKQKKQDEYDDQFKLKNQVRGLDTEEAEFLDYVSDRQQEVEKKRHIEDMEVIKEYQDKMMNPGVTQITMTTTTDKKPARTPVGASQNKSQLKLLAGAVKRKNLDKNGTEEKKIKTDNSVPQSGVKVQNGSGNPTEGKTPKTESHKETNVGMTAPSTTDSENVTATVTQKMTQVVAVLPGLPGVRDYSDTSDSDSSSSESSIETDSFKKVVHIHVQQT